MKLNKLFILAALALTSVFSACSDDDDVQPGAPAGPYNVTFAEGSNVVLASTDKTFDVVLTRPEEAKDQALTVPVQVVDKGIFEPQSTVAEFAAGSTKATITVAVPEDMDYNKAYEFAITIPESFTNPYLVQTTYPTYKVSVVKEDYALYATATFDDVQWYKEEWDVEIEYSPSQDLYRVKDLYVEGVHFYFKWNHETDAIVVTNSEGTKITKWACGLNHQTYGPISADCNKYAKYFGYYAEENLIDLPFEWVVAAGSFGLGECSFYDIKFVEQ